MSGSYLETTRHSGKFKDKDSIFKKLQSNTAVFPEEFHRTLDALHINKFLVYKKGSLVKYSSETLSWTVKLLSLL